MRISTVAGMLVLISSEAAAADWSVETVEGAPDLAAVWATPEGEIWVAGAKSAMHHKKGGGWVAEKVPAPLDWVDLHGTGGSDVWAVGIAAGLIHWDGTRWSSIAGFDGDAYVAIAAASPTAVAAINEDSVGLDRGKGWIYALGKGRPKGLRGLTTDGARFVAVGAAGLAILIDGKSWAPEKTGVDQALNAAAACPGGEAVAVGVSAARRDTSGRWRALAAPPVEVRGAVARCKGKKLELVAAVAGDEVLILDVAKNSWSRQTVAAGAVLTDIAFLGAGLIVAGKGGFVATTTSW